ncbi:MAG: hypothetical protein KDD62_11215 [Bdellovibrionales bacterium]|nr:hypothetical protein [Bdellovibrionales bacterium]
MPIISEDVLQQAETQGLSYLLIGGRAIQHYVANRQTTDIDLAIDRAEHEKWRTFLVGIGYLVEGIHKNFWRYTPPQSDEPGLDTLLIDSETYQRMCHESKELGNGIPTIEHLLALKIFALREDPGLRGFRDLKDIVSLMRTKARS